MAQTLATLAVDSLIENGIDTLYCVPGVQNDNLFDAIYHRQQALRPVHARHEQGAVYMALGAALATGRPQAYSVVPGPGFLNGTAALCTAQALNTPLFGLVGQIPSGAVGKGYGLLHEIEGQLDIMAHLSKFAAQVTEPDQAVAQFATAWAQTQSGRPGPVALELPVDCWLKPVPYDPGALHVTPLDAPQPDGTQFAEAARLITQARTPLIVVGGGAQNQSAPIRDLARRIGAGVMAFRNGHGVVPASDPLCLNMPTGHALWAECDLVIGLGTRLMTHKQSWGIGPEQNVLHIDIDADILHRVRAPTLGLHADLAQALPGLLDALPAQPDRSEWRQRMAEAKTRMQTDIQSALAPQLGWLSAIRRALPEDGLFVDELTQIGFVSRFAFPVERPRTFLSTGYQGTLGWGIATALGAAHARRDVPVVAIAGDGGALFTISELATAVHHNIPLNVVVMNDNAYGNVKGIQRDTYGERYIASDLTSPDFVALAQSFGVTATRATTPEGLENALAHAIAHDGPNLIEVPVGEFPSPWSYILLPKVFE